MSRIPTATHSVESTVIEANIEMVWNILSNFNFTWWELVENVKFEGGCATTVGSVATFAFKDGLTWTVEIMEVSSIKKLISFEIVNSSTPLPFTSAIHSISLNRVTSSNSTFIEWVSDFSSDASAEVVFDSSYKRLEAFANLRMVCVELMALSIRVNDVEARSRSNSTISSPRTPARSRGESLVSLDK